MGVGVTAFLYGGVYWLVFVGMAAVEALYILFRIGSEVTLIRVLKKAYELE